MNSHVQIQDCFNELSLLFKNYFGDPRSEVLPFQREAHEWLNYFYDSKVFRHVHLEYYKTDKICVLHSNAFPDPLVDLPIMGFDLIAIGDKITGLFFDFTPTVTTSHVMEHCLEKLHEGYKSKKRELPEWATFFSDKFYCITPDASELPSILKDIIKSIDYYFYRGKGVREEYEFNVMIQNCYCGGQQKNDKTFKALAAEVGADNAKLFMSKFLFPKIEISQPDDKIY